MEKNAEIYKTAKMVRIPSIDIIRGIAIFCVVWGHAAGCFGCTVDDPLSRILTSFNMPLFALIGGMLFKKPIRGKYISWIKRKVSRLVIPGLFWYLVIGMCYFLKSKGTSWSSISLWYLWGIAIVYFIVGTICNIFPSNVHVVLLCIANVLLWFVPNDLFYAGYLMTFFVIGMVLNQHIKWVITILTEWKKVVLPVSVIIYLIMLYYFKTDYYIYFGGISFALSNNIFLQCYVNFYRIIMALFFFTIIFYLYSILKNVHTGFVYNFLIESGKMILSIYIFHVIAIRPMLVYIPKLLEKCGIVFSKIGGVIIAIPTAIMLMVGCMLLTELLSRVPGIKKIAV